MTWTPAASKVEKVRMDGKYKNYHWYSKKAFEIAKPWEKKALSFWISSLLENLSCNLYNFLELQIIRIIQKHEKSEPFKKN